MPDTLTQNLTAAASSPAATDGFAMVRSPAGTPADEFLLFSQLWAAPAFLEAVRDAIGAALAAGTGVTLTVNDGADTITIAATGSYTDENARDAIGAALVAGTGMTITVDDGGNTITLASSGGGASSWALPAAINAPAGNIALTGLTTSTVQRITGLAGDRQIDKPVGSFPANTRNWVLFSITASGGPRTLTFGSGISHDGIGTAPSFVIPAGGSGTILLYTDDGGTTWYYSGDYDFATQKPVILAAWGMDTVVWPLEIGNPANGTKVLLRGNKFYSSIESVVACTDVGSCTVKFQVCDVTNATTNLTPTNAADVTGLDAIGVTTTPATATATAGKTLNKSGTTDRAVQIVISAVTGSPTILSLEIALKP